MSELKSIAKTTADWALEKNLKTVFKDSTESTNLLAGRDFKQNLGFTLYLAGHQTKGRGRRKNLWEDVPSACLLSSWSFKLSKPPSPITTPKVGLALYQCAKASWQGLEWSIKAPNDLYLKSKKVGGILISAITQGQKHQMIIGVGINVLDHPKNISHSGSIEQECGPITKKQWILFLDCFYQSLSSLDFSHASLNKSEQEELLMALNANPSLTKPYLEVSQEANLITESKTIHWHEL